MAFQLVTCPETAHLEMIEYEDSPFGMLLASCTRFRPACMVTCPRTCSARLDQGKRRATDPTLANGAEREDVTGELEVGRMHPFVIEATSLLRRRG